ncbi:hypothetical protein RB614_43515 [Phytohabitans sp. ZYX-F-186]|uniref:NACHT domain-containing protein n=1 Tax=Phytohabitans maris TaxID=3071409 RepID=A0ABU0ZZH6_9ACTN|nr:hypothetical protein [Phytohabitans sp. ZYX-F-186]MDQ7911377.1 hypothetical protein [Phytohabitans sp. ZYX-F-186]
MSFHRDVGAVDGIDATARSGRRATAAARLVLVDGLDEVLDADRRRTVVRKLTAVPGDRYRFVVATRPLADGELPKAGWPRFELLPLAAGLTGFAERWFAALGLPDPAASAAGFTRAVRYTSLAELARTPLIATMLCQLFVLRPERDLPQGRAGVYQSFVDLLRERRFAADGGIHPSWRRDSNGTATPPSTPPPISPIGSTGCSGAWRRPGTPTTPHRRSTCWRAGPASCARRTYPMGFGDRP